MPHQARHEALAVSPVRELKASLAHLAKVMEARDTVIAAARKVHKRVTSQYRTQRCVLELKEALVALEVLERQS